LGTDAPDRFASRATGLARREDFDRQTRFDEALCLVATARVERVVAVLKNHHYIPRYPGHV
jgi:hypothetical protein